MSVSETVEFVNGKLVLFDRLNTNLAVLLVVTTQDMPIENDYSEFSIRTTYSSGRELQDLVEGFKHFAAYVDVSYGEKEFIHKLASGQFYELRNYYKVVYTSTATGTARSKSALTPALCELYGLSICSNDIFTSALLDNKLATLGLLKHHNFRIPPTWLYSSEKGWIDVPPPPNVTLIAKPAYEAASIGITEKSVGKLSRTFIEHLQYTSSGLRQPLLVQKIIPGYEVEVPIFDLDGPFCPRVTGISLNGKQDLAETVLSYDTIFDDNFELYDYSLFHPDVAAHLSETAALVFNRLTLTGPVRIDFRVDCNGNAFIIDYNNSPHLGKQHSFAFALKTLGFSFVDVLKLVVLRSLQI